MGGALILGRNLSSIDAVCCGTHLSPG